MAKEITRKQVEQIIASEQLQLRPTQPALCIPIVNRLCKKMRAGVPFSNIKVVEGLIGEGHHRYIASLLAQTPVAQDPTVKTVAIVGIGWSTVSLQDNDWDNANAIDKHNQLDAETLGITVQELIERMEM